MQGKKTRESIIASIVSNKLADPELSLRDIAEKTGVSNPTVLKVLKEEAPGLLATSSNVKSLFEINAEIINIGVEKVRIAMQKLDPENIRDAKEMQSIVEVSFKQNQLIQGKATDKVELTITSIIIE